MEKCTLAAIKDPPVRRDLGDPGTEMTSMRTYFIDRRNLGDPGRTTLDLIDRRDLDDPGTETTLIRTGLIDRRDLGDPGIVMTPEKIECSDRRDLGNLGIGAKLTDIITRRDLGDPSTEATSMRTDIHGRRDLDDLIVKTTAEVDAVIHRSTLTLPLQHLHHRLPTFSTDLLSKADLSIRSRPRFNEC